MDNYGTHSHSTAEVKAWLRRHPRFVIRYVPTSCSWLNLIERWFAELANKRIRLAIERVFFEQSIGKMALGPNGILWRIQ